MTSCSKNIASLKTGTATNADISERDIANRNTGTNHKEEKDMRGEAMRALGIDHGKRTGWGVIENGAYRTHGSFELEGTYENRLLQFESKITKLIDNIRPDVICIEIPHDMTNGRTSMILIGYYTILLLTAFKKAVDVIQVHPTSMKKLVTGSGKAEKDDVALAMSILLGIEVNEIRRPVLYAKKEGVKNYLYDEADALALAYWGTIVTINEGELDVKEKNTSKKC